MEEKHIGIRAQTCNASGALISVKSRNPPEPVPVLRCSDAHAVDRGLRHNPSFLSNSGFAASGFMSAAHALSLQRVIAWLHA